MIPPLPIEVIEVALEQSAERPRAKAGARSACVLLRWNGHPIGHAVIPVENGVLHDGEWRSAVERVSLPMLRATLRERLEARNGLRPGEALPLPSVTIAVCTRDRTRDLARALTSLLAQDYAGEVEIVVVDNAPATEATATLCRTQFPTVRCVRESRPGLDWARNRAIAESHGEIVAFTDDDCVADAHWVSALVAPFASDPLLGCVTGLVFPLELETEAQWMFEAYGGFNRGYDRRWYRMDPRTGTPIGRQWMGTGQFGTGANMAFRRELFATLGGFDPALDVGTATQGAGDLEMYFRVLKAGYGLVYEPSALIRHGHRRDLDVLHRQLATWGSGMGSYLLRTWRAHPDERWGNAYVWMWMTQHWATRLARSLLQLEDYPASLVAGEVAMAVASPWRWATAQREAAEIARRDGALELRDPARDASRDLATRHEVASRNATRAVGNVTQVDVETAIPRALIADAPLGVRVVAMHRGIAVGHADLPAGSAPWSALQLSDALATAMLWQGGHALDLLDALEARDTTTAVPRPPSAAWPDALPAHVPVSIVIPTRDRPDDLRRCLGELCASHYQRPVEIIVVDNNPASGLTPPVVADFPAVRLVSEGRPGVSYARNAGFAASRGELIAMTDDDVTVGDGWLERLVAPFARDDVQVVTGNVLPLRLDAESQWHFEQYGGLGRGYWPWLADQRWLHASRRFVPRTWDLGGTANQAVRASWLRQSHVGPLDTSLGPGTPSGVGEDTEFFYRTLHAGGSIAYEPRAFVWHRHRDTIPALARQLRNYSSGHVAYHAALLTRFGDVRGLWHLGLDVNRHLVRRTRDRLLGRITTPWSLVWAEVRGFFAGPFNVVRTIAHARRHGGARPLVPQEPWDARFDVSQVNRGARHG